MAEDTSAHHSSALAQALHALTRGLRDFGAPFMLIGGLAVIARGVVRQTVDVDAVLVAGSREIERLVAVLRRRGLRPRHGDAVAFARQAGVILLTHLATGTDVDLSLAALVFEPEAIHRASEVSFGAFKAPVAKVEDLLVYKAIAGRGRDWEDVDELLLRHGIALNLQRVLSALRDYSRLVDDSTPIAGFERAIERAQLPSLE